MDLQMKSSRTLPPLVEGKIHGYLKFVISEVLWIRRGPSDVMVVASWWGEHDNAQFRPRDSVTGTERTIEDITQVYAIKTNAALFEDYIKNCDMVELMIVTENTYDIIGRGYITELSKIFSSKYYSQFIPILNNNNHKIGKLHVSLQLTYLTKLSNIQAKTNKYDKKEDILLFAVDNLQCNAKIPVRSYNNIENTKEEKSIKSEKIDTCNIYRSILKTKQLELQESRKNMNEMVMDKLVTQIVARAQHLREAILKETYKEDSLTLSDNSSSNESPSNVSSENKVKLYKYILGMEMTPSEEQKVLDTLRSISPNLSLIDLTSKIITTDKDDSISTEQNKNFSVRLDNPKEDILDKNATYTQLKGTTLLNYVNSIRIFIKSFTLTSAGYRRAKSICLQYGVPLIYFIQYDTAFGSVKQINGKSSKETKFIRTCAKKQVDQVINFNSEGIYNISRYNIKKNFPLKFKVFVKHCNQNLPTKFGFGFINIGDITNVTNLSSVQTIAIMSKGIKIGELKVIIELGCDFIHFGKEFVDAVIFRKENLSVSKKKSLMNSNDKYKSVTGTHTSKSNCKVSSAKQIEYLINDSNKNIIAKDITKHQEQSVDNKKIDTINPKSDIKDKVLLHGLIYVAEGKDLSESNTYLICRAFWREDKATSQTCYNTKNPFYHFFQLVPLIYGTELLERIRDNYIIIEVYNRENSGTDNLLGIAKLPVHQLYIAYRDPLVLSHLLLSKHPVISVDDWVNVNDPVSGKMCGKLLALVALGTVEQITLLEVSRGLRSTNNILRTDYSYHYCISDYTNNAIDNQESLQYNVPEVSNLGSEQSTRDNNFAYHVYNIPNQNLASVDYKTQESQTDISSLKNVRPEKPIQEAVSSEHLRTLVDRLTNVLHITKISTNQSAQIEINQIDEGGTHGELCLNKLNSNLTDDSDNCNPKNDFRLPMEMYRSVGVGAEYDENLQLDQQQNKVYNNPANSFLTERNAQKIESNINCNSSFFRSVIEIECALHLPKIEELNESVEPSTYVTFQDLTHKRDSTDQLNSYIATNVFLHSCNPKWNWRCDAKLSTDLLLNTQKRLILKVWHLIDPFKDINLKRDIVIGFSAIDLSILMTGFPTISGWFHIMDFTGKCNGQIKISITPLDNLSSLGKFATDTTNLLRCSNLSQKNWPYLYDAPCTDTKLNDAHQISYANQDNDKYVQNDCKLNVDIGHNLEDVSMSFLSLSLKQKLTELDEITKRLQLRLRDVTNTAFENEFDNDFDIIEPNSDNENIINDRNVETVQYPQSAISEYSNNETSQMPKQCEIQNDRNIINNERSSINSNSNLHFESASNTNRVINSEITDTGYCSSSNTRFSQHSDCYHNQYQNQHGSMHNYLSDNNTEYPVQGIKTHINHLLDKLSLDLPSLTTSSKATIPIRKNILELFANLREHRNNAQDKDKNSRDINTYTMLTQTDNEQYAHSHTTNFITSTKTTIKENVELPSNRISTVIREELVAEENNDSTNCDELTTYLITSNVRHMNLDNIFNPFLYQHLVPDLQAAAIVSPEGEAVKQLDNRYARSFNIAMSNNIDHSKENNTLFRNAQLKDQATILEFDKKKELFDLTSSGISENIDNSIDMTVIYKSNDDLTSGNSAESTAITSLNKSSVQAEVEIKDCCSILSELSVPRVSRQAPEGGNPIEEVKTS